MDDTTHSQDQPRHEFRIGSLTVPPVGVGTMYFGTTVAADVATTCLDEAADLGATFWDTANNYALWAGGTGGESETVIGDWFAARGATARDRVVLASKVGARPLPGHADLEHLLEQHRIDVQQRINTSTRSLHVIDQKIADYRARVDTPAQ